MTHELKLRVGSPHVLRDHIAEAVVGYSQGSNIRHTLEDLLAQVAEQLPTHTDEPEGFGSVVRARCPEDPDDVAAELWSPSPFHGKHYWQSEAGLVEVWSELTDVEVLRVGLDEKLRPDPNSYNDGVKAGMTVMNAEVHKRLLQQHAEATGDIRRNALEKAIQAVEELA